MHVADRAMLVGRDWPRRRDHIDIEQPVTLSGIQSRCETNWHVSLIQGSLEINVLDGKNFVLSTIQQVCTFKKDSRFNTCLRKLQCAAQLFRPYVLCFGVTLDSNF